MIRSCGASLVLIVESEGKTKESEVGVEDEATLTKKFEARSVQE